MGLDCDVVVLWPRGDQATWERGAAAVKAEVPDPAESYGAYLLGELTNSPCSPRFVTAYGNYVYPDDVAHELRPLAAATLSGDQRALLVVDFQGEDCVAYVLGPDGDDELGFPLLSPFSKPVFDEALPDELAVDGVVAVAFGTVHGELGGLPDASPPAARYLQALQNEDEHTRMLHPGPADLAALVRELAPVHQALDDGFKVLFLGSNAAGLHVVAVHVYEDWSDEPPELEQAVPAAGENGFCLCSYTRPGIDLGAFELRGWPDSAPEAAPESAPTEPSSFWARLRGWFGG